MVHLVFCIGVWTLTFTYLAWRSLKITKQAVGHLQLLHKIPCAQCAYFTGDYRLKCTVNPLTAMSENAIGCPDFWAEDHRLNSCHSCATNHCSKTDQQLKASVLQPKLTYSK